jgi:hypothetical protein
MDTPDYPPDAAFTYRILPVHNEGNLQVDLSRLMGPTRRLSRPFHIVYMGAGPDDTGIVILEAMTEDEIHPPPFGLATLTLGSTAEDHLNATAALMSTHGSKGYRFKGIAKGKAGSIILMVR